MGLLLTLALAATPRRAILLRVGIDQTFGGRNAPARGREYTYWPIPEDKAVHPHLATTYGECAGDLAPEGWAERPAHLDPDFRHLTYGDSGSKAAQIERRLKAGDLIVFYGAFRDLDRPGADLTYAIFGLYEIARIERARAVPERDWALNAHTRRRLAEDARDVVVTATAASGRFARLVPIGERRNGAYRVRTDLLARWGGVSARDGFLQRSGGLNFLNDPERFVTWLLDQDVSIVRGN